MKFEKKNEIVGKRSENSWKKADYWGDCDCAELWERVKDSKKYKFKFMLK
jgi:hypothetical protein